MAKPRACVVPCCQGEKFELVHKFPSDRERAELWKSILNIPELRPLDVDVIRGRYFVCSRHFRDADYKNKLSRSLNVTANPSLNLYTLCDSEGLSRIAPPMVRPGQTIESVAGISSKEPTFVTVSLDLQPVGIEQNLEKAAYVETLIHTEENVQDPLKKSPVLNPVRIIKRPHRAVSLAGTTPAKIFKFKQEPGTTIQRIAFAKVSPEKKEIVLKRIKMMPCQNEQVFEATRAIDQSKPIIRKTAEKETVFTASENSTDNQPEMETSIEILQSQPESEPQLETEDSKTTKVLALLECTPENLEKLRLKMKDGVVPFDENLFREITEDIEPPASKPIQQIDDKLFLTLERPVPVEDENGEPNRTLRISYVWLRDNCRCKECYNHETFQRSLSVLDIPDDVCPSSYEVQDQALNVIWNDGHTSTYELSFLYESQYEDYHRALLQEHSQPVLWDQELISLCPEYCRVTLNELLCDDDVIRRVVTSLILYGVAFIEKVPANQHSTEMAVTRIFPVHKTLFGEMWTFSDSMDHSDTAYTKNYLGPHTDNTYFSDASGLQILHCIQFNGTGGETILIDGFKAAEQLKLNQPDVFDRLCQYPVTAEYLEEGKNHTCCAPVIKKNIITGEVEQLRFNTYDRSVMKTIPQEQIPQFYRDYKQLAAEINNESMAWKFRLTPGTVMIFDNWRLLHGRTAYSGKRVMTGCYVSRTEYQSLARTLGIIS
ncbi:uncharacterized protein LOC129757360 [Uranotaenia lowii]|uniref:uncharacterized protein LOC129757360 n=1 Tax=Uranotaenia lowii TaxID=190385 RepID=UPI0024797E84|nr:uncharacterized protein LOC129757360 [Uranotaenia lowii]